MHSSEKLDRINAVGQKAIHRLQNVCGDEVGVYQDFTRATRIEERPDGVLGVLTTALQKAAEAGEVAGKFAKSLRDDELWNDVVHDDSFSVCLHLSDERRNQILNELSDDIYYISEMCNHFGISILDLMEINVHKLLKRANAGTLQGSGDNR